MLRVRSWETVGRQANSSNWSQCTAQLLRKEKSGQSKNPTTTTVPPQRQKVNPDEVCSYCGQKGHGKRATLSVRASVCPAYESKCKGCNKNNHYKSMCKSSDNPIIQDESGAVFDNLCSSSHNMIAASDHNQSSANHPTLRLSHHLYDEIQQSWTRRSSQPQPYIDLHITSS